MSGRRHPRDYLLFHGAARLRAELCHAHGILKQRRLCVACRLAVPRRPHGHLGVYVCVRRVTGDGATVCDRRERERRTRARARGPRGTGRRVTA